MFIDEDNQDGGYVDKYLLHDKSMDVHMKGKSSLFMGGYSMEDSGYYEKNVFW